MFNKSNLFPKTAEAPASRSTAQRSPAPASATDASMQRRPATPSPAPTGAAAAESSGRARDEGGKRDSRLIVGPDVKLKGAEILDCDTLVVEGRVDATMDSRVLRIADGGAFEGKVGVDVAEIHGRFDGELTVREQLVIHAGGRVSGKIRYGSIFIEEGGQICGDIMASEAESAVSRDAERSTARSDVREGEALAV